MTDDIKIKFHPDFFIELTKMVPMDEQQQFIDDLTEMVHKDFKSGGTYSKYNVVNSELMIRHIGLANGIEEFDEFGEFVNQDDEDEYVGDCYKAVDKKKLH